MSKTIKLQELSTQYDFVCNEWVKKFCNKQGVDWDGWVNDEVGGIACFATQYFFSLSDIVLDLKTKQKKGLIFHWQDDGVEAHFEGIKDTLNYKSYTMGLRYDVFKK